MGYVSFVKRLIDIAASAVLIVCLAPLMAAVAALVWMILGRPILHRDERAGLHGRPIRVTKFRSMTEARGPDGRLLPDAARLGLFGRFLRRASLDELPQLFGVLRGDMSLVGPRPLPLRYVPRYSARQATRLAVRPGLTGWAQIHGRNAVDWPERLELDARYVEMLARPWGLAIDLWIVCVTVFQIVLQTLTGRGISAAGTATMHEFAP
jgi:lipopolysaccharide/colanic/teichoic acid biosynthesis glycosyltransferase